jgi:hypothetical protein
MQVDTFDCKGRVVRLVRNGDSLVSCLHSQSRRDVLPALFLSCALNAPIKRRTTNAEQLGHQARGAPAGAVQLYEVLLLRRRGRA